MPGKYDESKDKVLAAETLTCDKGGFEIKICKYDGGDLKVQINPWYMEQGEKRYGKLGRIKLSNFEKIVEIVKRLEKQINL